MRICRAATIALALTWALPGVGYADEATVGEQIVDVINQLFGQQPDNRANHAKGIVVEGSFAPSAAGAALSSAVLFQGGQIPVTVRFSDATGVPDHPGRRPQRQPARHGGPLPPAGRQPDGHRRQLPGVLPGRHRRGLPRPAAGGGGERPGRRQADPARARSSPPTPRCRRRPPESGDAVELRARDLQRRQRLRLRRRRRQAAAVPLRDRPRSTAPTT